MTYDGLRPTTSGVAVAAGTPPITCVQFDCSIVHGGSCCMWLQKRSLRLLHGPSAGFLSLVRPFSSRLPLQITFSESVDGTVSITNSFTFDSAVGGSLNTLSGSGQPGFVAVSDVVCVLKLPFALQVLARTRSGFLA